MKEQAGSRKLGYWYSRGRTLGAMTVYGLLALFLGSALAISFDGVGNSFEWWIGCLAFLFFGGFALWEARRYFRIDRPALLIHPEGCEFWDGGSGELSFRWEEILPVEAVRKDPREGFAYAFSPFVSWLLRGREQWQVTVRYPQRGTGNRIRGEDLGVYTLSGKKIGADAREVVRAMNDARALALSDRACPLPKIPAEANDDERAEHARLRWFSEHTLPNDPWNERLFAKQLGPHTTEPRGGGDNQLIHTYEEIGARVIVKPGQLVVRGEWIDPRAIGIKAVRGLRPGLEPGSDARASKNASPISDGGRAAAMGVTSFGAPLPRSYSYSRRSAVIALIGTTLSTVFLVPLLLSRTGLELVHHWWWLAPLLAGFWYFLGRDHLRTLAHANGPALLLNAQGCQLWDAGGRPHQVAWSEVLPAVAVRVSNSKVDMQGEGIFLDLLCWLFRMQDWEITLRYPKEGTGNRFRGEDLGSVAVSSRAIGLDANVIVDEINRFRAHALRHSALALPELPAGAEREAKALHERKSWFVEHTLPNDPWDVGAFRDKLGSKTTEELPGKENFKAHTYESISARVIVRPGKLVVRAEWLETSTCQG